MFREESQGVLILCIAACKKQRPWLTSITSPVIGFTLIREIDQVLSPALHNMLLDTVQSCVYEASLVKRELKLDCISLVVRADSAVFLTSMNTCGFDIKYWALEKGIDLLLRPTKREDNRARKVINDYRLGFISRFSSEGEGLLSFFVKF